MALPQPRIATVFDSTEEPPARPAPDFRQRLTILFSDLCDSTRLAAGMEAEHSADLMNDLRGAFREAVTSRGGTVNQFQGDALQALFGYPWATEHDCRLAVEAALDVHGRVRTLRERYSEHGAGRLAVHSGIHAGLVLVRPGVEGGSRLELSGTTPGVAKHLSDVAVDDELLVSADALGPISHLFETVEREPVHVKGRAGPLPICGVRGTTPLRTRFQAHVRRGLFPFVGRAAELQRMDRALASAQAGGCQFVLVRGSPGLGKTRLAEEFLRRAEQAGFGIARGDCDGGLGAEPLQPFVQILRARLGVAVQLPADVATGLVRQGLEAIDPALVQRLPELLQALALGTADGSVRSAPETTIDALRDVFVTIARRQPQVLFLDDWQWSDDATRRVVHALCASSELALLLLAASRPADAGEVTLTSVETIDLGPLSDGETAHSIAGLLPDADPFLVEEIGRRSGGNPLFVEELCHYAVRNESRSLDALLGGPAWLETLIESRVARLPRVQHELLAAAAVIGNAVSGSLLEKLTGHALAEQPVQELARQDLLVPSEDAGGLRFKHGITRQVVYAAIGLQQRCAMHRRIADLLLAEGGAQAAAACEALAYHCAGAGDTVEAARYSEVAGDKALAASSLDRAKMHYRAALEMVDRLPSTDQRYRTWRSLIRRLGLSCVYDPMRDDLSLFHRAVDEAQARNDVAGRAYAEYWLAYLHYSLGDASPALAHGRRSLDDATAVGDPWLVQQVRIMLGQALAAAADYENALPLLGDPERLANSPKPTGAGAPPAFAYALAVKASVLGDLGRFGEAEACFDAALAALPLKTHEVEGSILCWRAAVALWQGRFDDAHRHALSAKRVADQVRSLYLYAMALGLGGYAEWKLEPGMAAQRRLADATTWLDRHGKHLFISLNFGWLTEALAASGRMHEARAHAACTLRRARQGDWLGAPMAMRALARAAAQEGAIRAAEQHLARAEAAAHRRTSAHEVACNSLCRGQIDAMAGRRGAARETLDLAERQFAALGMQWHQRQTMRLLDAS